jgi:GNAT superfamily N-acetyltransferase
MLSGADVNLAARLEAAESSSIIRIAEASAGSANIVAVESFAGGTAVFAGPASPITHAMGIGLRGDVRVDDLIRMEQFFRDRGSACVVDLCPLAHPSVLFFFQARPYRLAECNNVMVRIIAPDEPFEVSGAVRRVSETEYGEWSSVVCRAFSEQMPVTDEAVAMMSATCKASQCWLAGSDEAVAAAAMSINNGVAHLYGDATLPSARRAGWHAALIRARLSAAQRQGCELAMGSVLPGSQSHRNYERAGFQLLYMRVNLFREFEGQRGPAPAQPCVEGI